MTDSTQPTGPQLPPKPVDLDKIEDAVRTLLTALGQGEKAEVMKNTPRRIAEMYGEIINAPWCDIEVPWKTFPNPGVQDLIMVTDCHYVSMCEHHLMPALGVAHFGYVPDELITGYSKVKKALNYVARQPQLNERIMKDALDAVVLSLKPKWCGLVLSSVHMCLVCKSNAPSQEVVTIQDFRLKYAESDGDKAATWRRDFLATVYGKRPVFGAGY